MNKKPLIIIGAVILLLIVAAVVVVTMIFKNSGPVALTYWGLWEEASVYQEVIADYQKTHPNVTIKYQKMAPTGYRERITAAMSGNSGPDIVRIHNSWLPMMRNSMAPFPENVYPVATFKQDFYPVAVTDLTDGKQVWGVPLETDNILMFVNNDIFTAGGAKIPTTWEDFAATTEQLTVKDESGRINTSGTVLGTASNVDHWQEILGMMMLQAGVNLNKNPGAEVAAEAVGFYTGFVNVSAQWNETLDQSTLAFASGIVGTYFGPSWRYFDIKAINPDLNFQVAPVPQLANSTPVNYATYWAEAVSKKSANQAAAFEFLKYLSSKEALTKIYSAQSKLREFGEPYPRVDMASLVAEEPVVGVVISQAPVAKSWYLDGFTFDGDTGINSKIGTYYHDAINSVLESETPQKALETAAAGVEQVLGQYGLVSSGN